MKSGLHLLQWKLCLALISILLPVTLLAQVPSQVSPASGNAPSVSPVGATSPTGSMAPTSAPTSAPKPANADRLAMRISAGDLLEISVYGVDDLKREVRVNSAGEISFPLIGSMVIAGMPSDAAERAIAQKLREGNYIKDPQVVVFVKEYVNQSVSVLGEVSKPGLYPVFGERHLFDVLSAAGGMTNKAGRLITITRRSSPGTPISITLDDDAARATNNNVEVYPDDTIVVSRAGIIYVVGDVGKPGGFTMDNNERLSVLQAIALAQGTNRTASLNSAKLIRRGPAGPEQHPLLLKKILESKEPDQYLRPEDIIFVPNSTAKSAGRKGLEAVLQTVTGVIIYSSAHY